MQYKENFIECASYYTEQLKFKYEQCATDFDSFLHYFESMYMEGLRPMLNRAYSLLLPLGIYDCSLEMFSETHLSRYNKAYQSFQTVAGIEANQNQVASQAGNLVGNSVQLRGGGFGIKGALKGVAKAEAFNFGMNALGKLIEHQASMSREEKAAIWRQFNSQIFFQEVYHDYLNVLSTLIHILSQKELAGEVTIDISQESQTIFANLNNPMFPAEQFISTCVKLINKHPFILDYYSILENKIGQNAEIDMVRNYFKIS